MPKKNKKKSSDTQKGKTKKTPAPNKKKTEKNKEIKKQIKKADKKDRKGINLKEILLKESYVTEEDIKKAESYAKKTKTTIKEYLITNNILTLDLLGQAIAEFYNIKYADLNTNIPTKAQIIKIPEKIAKKYRLVLFKEGDKEITVTTDKPNQKDLKKKLKKFFKGKSIELAYSIPEDIDTVHRYYKKSLKTRFNKILKSKKSIAPELVNEIFNDAINLRASDIHFEPNEKEVIVRFRIDGMLIEAGVLPKENYDNILNRIKVLAQMRIDEHYAAQDGAIRYFFDGGRVDMRVSVVPVVEGEKIVIRLLSQYVRSFSLFDLGLNSEHEKYLKVSAKKPHGMIIVTGPTGSGKTTTLYALLKFLNKPEINLTTIEDPVEYRLTGINQIQVNSQTDLTFAKGLRSIVRQDPDIILVGEIRDIETAEISVNAALTGHLLLSTFHANDAASTIPRMLDMGVEPFLLSSTLELVIGQRLVRKICENCKISYTASKADLKKEIPGLEKYFSKNTNTLYKGKGCDVCNGTGYKGRSAIFEFLQITPELEELILKNPSSIEIKKIANKVNGATMFYDGIDKVKRGITTIGEVKRVAEVM